MKLNRILWALLMLVLLPAFRANAIGWPSNYGGVMLQGFYWDSYKNGWKWTNLTANAEEISEYFDLMWLPNSCKSEGGEGYHPMYWFSNFNSSYGSESEYEAMRQAFQSRGVGLIAEAVLNHRTGVTGWVDFPTESWRGQTMHIGLDGICRDDECKDNGYNPTGAYDTGEKWSGARDLDHTNANVQANCIAWERFMLEDKGYVGFRFDFVKGFGGQYIKMYNQAAKPTFSVGECWDGYDYIVNWINSTGKESAAFDFPVKWALNDAFRYNDMNKLSWLADGKAQPAGLIHQPYNRQLAVTFVDNHDTYKEPQYGYPFPDDNRLGAAYAFILCQPGTPCVLLKHWIDKKAEIKALITARKLAGITNTSTVNVLQINNSCYMAEVQGTKGKLVVKVGSAMVSPSGYSASDIKASGNDYCVWVKTNTVTYPDQLYILGNVTGWNPSLGVTLAKSAVGKYTATGVALPAADATDTHSYFNFATKLSTSSASWDGVNSANRYGPSSDAVASTTASNSMTVFSGSNAGNCKAWKVAAGTYDITVDLTTTTFTINASEGDVTPTPTPEPTYPENVYLMGTVKGNHWATTGGVKLTKGEGGVYTAEDVELENVSGAKTAYFNFATSVGADWDAVNATDRYGANSSDAPVKFDADNVVVKFAANRNAASCCAWTVAAGTYTVTLNLATNRLTLVKTGEAPDPEPEHDTYPADMYIQGSLAAPYAEWATNSGFHMTKGENGVYTATGVTLNHTSSSFSFCTKLSTTANDWTTVNSSDRYGTPAEDTQAVLGDAGNAVKQYVTDVDASSCKSWKVENGVYTITLDLANMKMTIVKTADCEAIDPAQPKHTVYVHKPKAWSIIKCYAWGNNTDYTPNPSNWAGVQMQKLYPNDTKDDVYYIEFEGTTAPSKVIFNNGNGGGSNQTGDLDFVSEKIYTLSANGSNNYSASTPADYNEYSVAFDNSLTNWKEVYVYLWNGTKNNGWPGKKMIASPAGVRAMAEGEEATATHTHTMRYDFTPANVLFNDGVDNSGNKTADLDFSNGSAYEFQAIMPEKMYVIGTINNDNWNPNTGVEMEKEGNYYIAPTVNFTPSSATDKNCYFSFTTVKSASWETVNKGTRYNASEANREIELGTGYTVYARENGEKDYAWKFPYENNGDLGYRVEVNFVDNKVTVTKNEKEDEGTTGIETIELGTFPVEYYTLQGVRVFNPGPGFYIVRSAGRVAKVLFK